MEHVADDRDPHPGEIALAISQVPSEGEGIEKQESDFAAEVAAAAGQG